MDNKKSLDLEAMKLVMVDKMQSEVLGIFGDEETDACIAKMHAMLELAETLQINDLEIKIKIKDLQSSRKDWLKVMANDDE